MSLLKFILFGHHGAGKTCMIGTGVDDPRLWPGLILDFEGGTDSIASKVQKRSIKELGDPIKGKFDFVRIESWDMFEDCFAILNDPSDSQNVYLSHYVDSLTEINYLNLRRAVTQAITKERREDKYTPQLQDYGRSGAELKYLFRCFRDLPTHSMFTALGHEDTDELTGTKTISPSLIGKLAEEIPGLVNTVGYIRARRQSGSIIREVMFQPDGKVRAKDRSEGGKLGDVLENPTLTEILDLLEIGLPALEGKSDIRTSHKKVGTVQKGKIIRRPR